MWIYDLFLWSSPNHTPIKYTCLIKNTNWIIPAYLKSMASATSMTRSRPTSPVVEHLHVALHTTPHQKGPRMYVYRSCSSILATLASLVPMWVWWPITNNCESITAYMWPPAIHLLCEGALTIFFSHLHHEHKEVTPFVKFKTTCG